MTNEYIRAIVPCPPNLEARFRLDDGTITRLPIVALVLLHDDSIQLHAASADGSVFSLEGDRRLIGVFRHTDPDPEMFTNEHVPQGEQ